MVSFEPIEEMPTFLKRQRQAIIKAFVQAVWTPLRWNLSNNSFTPSELYAIGDSYYSLSKTIDGILRKAARYAWRKARIADGYKINTR